LVKKHAVFYGAHPSLDGVSNAIGRKRMSHHRPSALTSLPNRHFEFVGLKIGVPWVVAWRQDPAGASNFDDVSSGADKLSHLCTHPLRAIDDAIWSCGVR
jgi:hypothetical protein